MSVSEQPSFLDQLTRRHVFRVAAMYAVTSWLLLQIASVTFEPLGFPAWSQRALIILLIAGFPIALALAWIFDVTPEGVVRTDAGRMTGLSRGRKFDIVIIVVLLVALAVALLWRREPTADPVAVQGSSIAVLPFVAMSDDASFRQLGAGLSDQITNELAGRPEVRVASRTSAFEQTGKDAVAIARGLGVAYVLEGSVRPSDGKVRVTAQLVRGQDGLHVWSDSYDVAATDAAGLDRTAALIAVTANGYMQLEYSLQVARTSTRNAKAYEHYAASRKLAWQQRTGGTSIERPSDQVLGELDRAIALDPGFFLAHVRRAGIFHNKMDRGAACGTRCITEARGSIDRALALRPDDPAALQLLGLIQLLDELDPAEAERSLVRARQIDPRTRGLDESFATLATFRGNAQDARDYLARQLEATPHVASIHAFYAVALRGLGDLAGAERAVQAGLRLAQRGEAWGLAGLHIELLIRLGELDRAKAEFGRVWAQHRYTHPERFGRELALLGYESEAAELAARLSQDPDVDPFFVFLTYYGLGRYDDALAWLRRVIDGRGYVVWFLRLPNQFPGLQEQPGYAELLEYLDSIQRSR